MLLREVKAVFAPFKHAGTLWLMKVEVINPGKSWSHQLHHVVRSCENALADSFIGVCWLLQKDL